MINFKCSKCGEPLEAPQSLAGQTVLCPKCNLHEKIPVSNINLTTKRLYIYGGISLLAGFIIGFLPIDLYLNKKISILETRNWLLQDNYFDELQKNFDLSAQIREGNSQSDLLRKNPIATQAVVAGLSEIYTSLNVTAHWEGSGIRTTETFQAISPWRLKWELVHDQEDYGSVGLVVYKRSPSGSKDIVTSAFSDRPGQGESWVYETGIFFIEITGLFGSWQVVAEQR